MHTFLQSNNTFIILLQKYINKYYIKYVMFVPIGIKQSYIDKFIYFF